MAAGYGPTMRAVLIVLAAAVAIGVACVVVYCRRRRLAQAALEETRRAAESLLIPESSSHHEEEGTGDSHKEINSLAVETAAHDAHEAEAGRTSEKALARECRRGEQACAAGTRVGSTGAGSRGAAP